MEEVWLYVSRVVQHSLEKKPQVKAQKDVVVRQQTNMF